MLIRKSLVLREELVSEKAKSAAFAAQIAKMDQVVATSQEALIQEKKNNQNDNDVTPTKTNSYKNGNSVEECAAD